MITLAQYCTRTGITVDALKSRRRSRMLCDTRAAYMLYLYDVVKEDEGGQYSLKRIGRIFNRDHATVLHELHKARFMLKFNDEIFRELWRKLDMI
jgi:chromosomal replication initiation ATPase DnaA